MILGYLTPMDIYFSDFVQCASPTCAKFLQISDHDASGLDLLKSHISVHAIDGGFALLYPLPIFCKAHLGPSDVRSCRSSEI